MSLPKRTPGRVQTRQLPSARVYDEEFEQIRNRAIQSGQTVSQYIRSQCLANRAPFSSQLSTDKPSENTSSLAEVSSALPLAASDEKQASCEMKKNTEENAGRSQVKQTRASAKAMPNKTECPHGYKIIGGRTACSECKRKL